MTPLLICAAVVVAFLGWAAATALGALASAGFRDGAVLFGAHGLALIAVALWLAYAAGGRA